MSIKIFCMFFESIKAPVFLNKNGLSTIIGVVGQLLDISTG